MDDFKRFKVSVFILILKAFAKSILFFCGFAIVFVMVQNTLKFKWDVHEFTKSRLNQYKTMTDIDVLFMGTSTMYAGITPIVAWKEYGITGFNFGVSCQNALCNYYLLLQLLEYNTPKVLVIDFCSLFSERSADESLWEQAYRKTYETIEDNTIRKKFLTDVHRYYPGQNAISYALPLFRYHDRWEEITQKDFIVDSSWYKPFFLGGLLNDVQKEITMEKQYYRDDSAYSYNDLSLFYYSKIVELCREKEIQIVCVNLPEFQDYNCSKNDMLLNYCESNNITFIDYDTAEEVERLQLNPMMDYYDQSHLSIDGSIKITLDLSHKLKDAFQLEDKRSDVKYSIWNEMWDGFVEQRQKNLVEVNMEY